MRGIFQKEGYHIDKDLKELFDSMEPGDFPELDLSAFPEIDLSAFPEPDLSGIPEIDLSGIPEIDLSEIPSAEDFFTDPEPEKDNQGVYKKF